MLGIGPALELGMMTHSSTTLLTRASTEIENNRPFWGLIQANIWFAENESMKRVLANKAKAALESDQYSDVRDIVEALLAGAAFESLTAEQQLRARGVVESAPVTLRRTIPTMPEYRVRVARAVPTPRRRFAY